MTDPYQVLGISPGASRKEIKSAYRQLCRQYHPDRNPDDQQASERLQQVMHAYQQLNNSPGANLRSPFPDLHSEVHQEQEVEITFSQAFTGQQKTITVHSQGLCQHCGGSGAAPGHHPQSCRDCQGSGRRHQDNSVADCQSCRGRGFTIDQPCNKCHQGRVEQHSSQEIFIPPGVWNGYRIMASAGSGQSEVVIKVRPSAIFQRYNENPENLYLKIPITYAEAALGAKVTIPTPEKIIGLKIPPGTASGKKFKISGQGMPILGQPDKRGDLLVQADIAVPDQLSSKHQRIVAELEKMQSGQDLRRGLFNAIDQ